MINVEIDAHAWYSEKDEAKWKEIDWSAIRELWPAELPEEKPEKLSDWPYGNRGPHRLTYTELSTLANMGIPLKLIPLPAAMVVKMQDREREWNPGERVGDALSTGDAVQITIPDMGLLLIKEVIHRDDACTDEIQDLLSEGYRILAVCPPNAQRRPDYILGK